MYTDIYYILNIVYIICIMYTYHIYRYLYIQGIHIIYRDILRADDKYGLHVG